MTTIPEDVMQTKPKELLMTEFPIQIETDETGITISQACPSPEWSITGKGGRADTVFIANADIPAVLRDFQRRMNEINERESI
jgi:hypothetical protein